MADVCVPLHAGPHGPLVKDASACAVTGTDEQGQTRRPERKKRRSHIADEAARFWSYVDKSGECWMWRGELNEWGCGRFAVDGRRRGAHRVSWRLAFGPVPDDVAVYHRCGNNACVRPDHLMLAPANHVIKRSRPEYVNWRSMNDRCHRVDARGYRNYGGRGIAVCARWRTDFAAFLADMGPKPSRTHTIDRLENKAGNARRRAERAAEHP